MQSIHAVNGTWYVNKWRVTVSTVGTVETQKDARTSATQSPIVSNNRIVADTHVMQIRSDNDQSRIRTRRPKYVSGRAQQLPVITMHFLQLRSRVPNTCLVVSNSCPLSRCISYSYDHEAVCTPVNICLLYKMWKLKVIDTTSTELFLQLRSRDGMYTCKHLFTTRHVEAKSDRYNFHRAFLTATITRWYVHL